MAAAESSSSVVRAEALIYTLCLSSKIELILKEEQKLAIFLCSLGERFLYGSQQSICFQMIPFLFYRRHTRLGFISKKQQQQPNLVHSVRVTLRCE